jgi:hypothetical protein
MLYTFLRTNLENYQKTLMEPEIAMYVDEVVSNVLREVVTDKYEYTHLFDKHDSPEFIEKIVKNIREVFKDSLILSYSLTSLTGEVMESGIIISWN